MGSSQSICVDTDGCGCECHKINWMKILEKGVYEMEDGSPVTISIPQGQQSAYWGRYNDAAEAGIYDSDYFRMRQMSVGYTFPSSMLEGTFIQAASVSLIGKNLFFLTNSVDNIDPESAYNAGNSAGLEWFGLAVPRTIGVNVNLKF